MTLFCRSWQCADCAPVRLWQLKKLAMAGNPSTFITLTVNPAHGQSAAERAAELSDAWRKVAKRIRRKFTKEKLEYLAVFEETTQGEPHLHILARAPYVPQKWLSETMAELIEAPIVDIRKVGSKAGVARYVAKYIAKGPRAFDKLKRYWTTPNFDAERSREPRMRDEWGSGWRVWQQSLFTLAEEFRRYGIVAHWIDENHAMFFAQSQSPPRGGFYET